MKKFAKFALGAVMLAGAATVVAATPADARVSVGIGIGVPGYYYGPSYYPRYNCDPYSRFYDPYYCGGYARPYYGGNSFYFNYRDGWGGRDWDDRGWRGRDGDDRGWRGGDRDRGRDRR